MLLPASQALPSSLAHEPDITLARRRHGQDDGANSGPGGGSGGGDPTPSTNAADLNAPVVPAATSTSVAPSPAATSMPSTLHFLDVQNATTCQSYTVSWSYDGPSPGFDIALSVNENPMGSANNNATTSGSSGHMPSPARVLSNNISSTTTNFTWESVDLDGGWYTLSARAADPGQSVMFTPQSTSLYVVNGTDVSCVRMSRPVPSSGSRPHLSTGDIVAIIIGAIAAAGLLAIAFAFPRFWRRDLPSRKRRRPYYLY
ncbi:hypothetical protein P691DRAFT_81094 [Macrolepiota fuliginosa MF-IS2]|uniref:Uncharacterized protein n=1 Tax=Macrolepiota fuliginosa MF-IS2 TaxID=1400762 RepID=A0A9P6C8T5_9AGAR|nr:hypothetical protein P691DRAFT_81094 [Macrolepiota fuliginosa MF-IS2]